MIKKLLSIAAVSGIATLTSQSAALLAHYTFDTDGSATVGSASTLGDAASITTTAQVGAGSLSLSGAPTIDTAGADGAVGGDTFTWATDTRTVAFWVQATAGDVGDTNATMISLGSGTLGGERFDIRLTGNALRLEVQGGGTTTSQILADSTWHHVAIVVQNSGTVANTQYSIDGGTLTAFGGSTTALITGSGPLRIGDGYQDLGRDFKGLIDDVRLYDGALTQSEIIALAAVPEPSAAALLGLGGLALLLRRRKG